MHIVIKISTHKRIVVAERWVKGFSKQRLLNYGVNTQKRYTVFYSTDQLREPNFQTNLSPWQDFINNCEDNVDACYIGTIECTFGMCRLYTI